MPPDSRAYVALTLKQGKEAPWLSSRWQHTQQQCSGRVSGKQPELVEDDLSKADLSKLIGQMRYATTKSKKISDDERKQAHEALSIYEKLPNTKKRTFAVDVLNNGGLQGVGRLRRSIEWGNCFSTWPRCCCTKFYNSRCR